MMDAELDWESLKWTISNDELSLNWHFGPATLRGHDLKNAPVKAHFFWRLDGRPCWGIHLDRVQLDACIAKLESEGVSVPTEFREASEQFALEI